MLEEFCPFRCDDQEKECLSNRLKERPGIKYWTPAAEFIGSWVFWDRDQDISTTNLVIADKVLSGLRSSSLRSYAFADAPVMVQFWAPITIGGRRLLATSDQPFCLSHLREGFCAYRKECVALKLCVEAEEAGMLVGVFRNKCIASTPNVAYYSVTEYPQRELALKCNVRALFAVPLFESSTQNCAGVLEFLSYGDKVASITCCLGEMRYWFKFDLILGAPRIKESFAEEHPTLRDMMHEVDKLGGLHLLVVWEACSVEHRHTALEKSCPGFDQICLVESSNSFEDDIYFFVENCRDHHLQKGQGLVGMACLSGKPYFCRDITKFTSNQYPLVHHARHAGLAESFAICMHDSFTDHNFILELFFNPGICEDPGVFLGSLMITLEKFPNFKVASREGLSGEELCVESVQFGTQRCQTIDSAPNPGTSKDGDGDRDGGDNLLVSSSDQQAGVEVEDDASSGNDAVVVDDVEESEPGPSHPQDTNTEFLVVNNCETIKKHFGRSLDDAANRLGVSRSTLKRICRQNGIPRWPYKRNRANHSSRQPPIPHLLPQRPAATVGTAVQDESIITFKAKYKKKFLKFEFPFSSGMVELEQQLSKRLKFATYEISYLDEEGDSIVIACDEDLQSYMNSCRSLGRNTIKISVVPGKN